VIGREARAQLLEAEERLPRSSSPASAAGRTRSGCSPRSSTTRRPPRRRRGGGRRVARHGPARGAPRRALVGARRRGRQIADAHSISAASTTRRRARARVAPGHRPREYVPCTDDEALDAFARLTRSRGSSPRSSRPTRSPSSTGWTPSTSPSASRGGGQGPGGGARGAGPPHR
jgi:hypothetical protein